VTTIQFVPEVCKSEGDKAASFEGHVVIQCPDFDQRYGLIEKAGFEMDADGKMLSGAKQLPAIRKAVKIVKEMDLIKEVALKKLADASEFKSFEDLTFDPDCDPILIELAMQVMNGFRPSKK
jgi:hypothetical protein